VQGIRRPGIGLIVAPAIGVSTAFATTVTPTTRSTPLGVPTSGGQPMRDRTSAPHGDSPSGHERDTLFIAARHG